MSTTRCQAGRRSDRGGRRPTSTRTDHRGTGRWPGSLAPPDCWSTPGCRAWTCVPLGDTHVFERVVERKHGRSGRGQTVANMSRPEVWAEYDRWNAVIANVVFPELDHVAPAYLDLEDEMLEEIASAMGVQAEDVEGSLANAVAATLDQSTPRL